MYEIVNGQSTCTYLYVHTSETKLNSLRTLFLSDVIRIRMYILDQCIIYDIYVRILCVYHIMYVCMYVGGPCWE